MANPAPTAGDVFLQTSDGLADTGLLWIATGYAVRDRRVLLVFHNRFHKWVPPGGHVEPGETFSQAALREFEEETGIAGEVLSASPEIHPSDTNANADRTPFYVDVLREGFRKPALAHYFYIRPFVWPEDLTGHQQAELDGMALFSLEELTGLDTFAQVRSVSRWVIANHPGHG